MIRIKLLLIFFIYISLFNITNAQIKIEYKIGDEIVTNIDILDEINYLIFLRPNLKNLSNEEIKKIAENSIIREIIKKKELDKILKEFEITDYEEQLKKNLFSYLLLKVI